MDTFLDNLRSLIIAVAAAAVCYVLFLLAFGDKKAAREGDIPIYSGNTAVAVADPDADALPSVEDEALAVVRETFGRGAAAADTADDIGVTEDIQAADTAAADIAASNNSRPNRDLSSALSGSDNIAEKADEAFYQAVSLPSDSGFRFAPSSLEQSPTEELADTGASIPLTEITLPPEIAGSDAAETTADTVVDTVVDAIADTTADTGADNDDFFAGRIDAADDKADELFADTLGISAPVETAEAVPAAETPAADSAMNEIEDDDFFAEEIEVAETNISETQAGEIETAETNISEAPAVTEAPAGETETAENNITEAPAVTETPSADNPAPEFALLDIGGDDFFSDAAETAEVAENTADSAETDETEIAETDDFFADEVNTAENNIADTSADEIEVAETDIPDAPADVIDIAENNTADAPSNEIEVAETEIAENNIAENIDVQAPAVDIAPAEADAYRVAETEPSVAAEVADTAPAPMPQPSAAGQWVTPRDLSSGSDPSGRNASAPRVEAARSLALSAPSSKIPLTPWLENRETAAETAPLTRAPQNTAEELPVSQEIIDSFESVAESPAEAPLVNASFSPDGDSAAPEQTAQAEPAPAAEEQTAQAEPAPAAEEQTAQAEPAPAAEEQTAQAEPAPAAEESGAAVSTEGNGGEVSVAEQQAAAPVLENDVWYIDASRADYRPETLTFYRYDQANPVASSLDEFIATSTPERPIFILVHGNLTDAGKAVQHGMSVRGHLQQIQCADCQAARFRLVIWKWPSEKTYQGILPDSQYKANLADQCGFALAGFLGALPPGPPVTLIGFSFGARTVGSAMTLLAGGAVQGQAIPAGAIRQGNALFNVFLLAAASDCGDYSLQGKYGPGLSRVINIVNAYNPSDKALSFYTFLYPGYPTQAQGTVPILTPSPNLTNHTWSVNTSMYGPEHRFENYLAALGPGLGVTLSMGEKSKN